MASYDWLYAPTRLSDHDTNILSNRKDGRDNFDGQNNRRKTSDEFET